MDALTREIDEALDAAIAVAEAYQKAHDDAYPTLFERNIPIPDHFDRDLFMGIMPYLQELVDTIGSDSELQHTFAFEASRQIKRILLDRRLPPPVNCCCCCCCRRPQT